MSFANTIPVEGMKTGAMVHQAKGLELSAGKWNFAYLMEQGTGKTWITIADIVRAYLKGRINAVIVYAPKGVHTNWVLREFPTHADIPFVAEAWRGKPTSKKARARLDRLYADHYEKGKEPLRIFTINIDAINHDAGHAEALRFLRAFPNNMGIVDESTRIKNPDAKRAQKIVKLGKLSMARRILSGTPLTKNPGDMWMQYQFLKEGILGVNSYRAFVAQYTVLLEADDPRMVAIMRKTGSRYMPQIAETDDQGMPVFKNLDKLISILSPHSYRVTKEEALPHLPPKVYKRVYFELTPEQRKIYDLLEQDYEYVVKNNATDAEYYSFEAIAARSKLKQVTSGFINLYGEPQLLPLERNPRLQAFKELIEGLYEEDPARSVIIWAMYDQEIAMAVEILNDLGISNRVYNGSTKKDDRERIIDDFQAGEFTAFVGHPAAGGIGITLTRATITIYLSTSEDAELRLQSEDRNHRIGTASSVLYFDLHAENTVDDRVFANVEHKKALMEYVVNGVMRLENQRSEIGADLDQKQREDLYGEPYDPFGPSMHNLTLEHKQ